MEETAAPRVGAEGRPRSSAALSVSAAVSTYDSARFVREQLDSILAQTTAPAQIVVGDDGSSDETMSIVMEAREECARRGLDIEWSVLDASTHLGLRDNMARILQACTGDVVVVCDSDDVCLPERFEHVVQWFTDRPGDLMVCSDALVIDSQGRVTAESMMSQRTLSEQEWSQLRSERAFELLVRRFVAEGAVSAYRRTLLQTVPPCPDAVVFDAWLALLASAMTSFGFDDRPGIKYRVHGRNNSGGVKTRSRAEKLRMLLAPGAERNRRWLERTGAVLAGVEAVRIEVPTWAYDLAAGSAAHQRVRAGYPANRLLRAPAVLRQAGTGAYGRFARGPKDVLLDLVQPNA